MSETEQHITRFIQQNVELRPTPHLESVQYSLAMMKLMFLLLYIYLVKASRIKYQQGTVLPAQVALNHNEEFLDPHYDGSNPEFVADNTVDFNAFEEQFITDFRYEWTHEILDTREPTISPPRNLTEIRFTDSPRE